MEILFILFFGFLFGAILRYASLNRYDVISGMATLEDLSVAKAIALAVGVGVILINFAILAGLASYHVKPFLAGGVMLGGLIFGSGMAILGYCPGTLAISAGEGSLDAVWGIFGGLLGGWVYTLTLPVIEPLLGPDLGKISLYSFAGKGFLFSFIVVLTGILFVRLALWMDKKEGKKDKRWVRAGLALALLNLFVFLKIFADRPIGASTTYPYVADVITGTTGNAYFEKISTPGQWELIFLAGAFLAGLILSLLKKEFSPTLLHDRWKRYKGTSMLKRSFWAFAGGFILIYGARMAGGCTSGHILSGGMQLALSSLVFALFTFAGLLLTGWLFYAKKAGDQ